MYSQAELETILSIAVTLFFLAASVNIYWILNGWQRERDHRVESYVKELRRLAEDE
jgi:hypothetical protein